jgi:N-acetylglucosaminyl-diphospho-decaprenol L-rhamnosyltransferase
MSGPFQGGTEAARVVVALVSYEARDTLLSTLDSLSHLELPAEVVVVDNASTDGSAEAVRARHPRARLIANPENVGFARACNQGFRASAAPLVLFLNPDAELEPGALSTLARVLDERPDVGLVGPRIRFPDGTIQVSTGPDLSLLAELRLRRLVLACRRRERWALERAEASHGREHEPDWISGACILARRTTLEALSGFDERFFLYEEDADLCRRARAAGWKVVFTPSAEVRHGLGRSMARAANRSALEYHRSHLLYYRLHNGLAARIVLRKLLAARGLIGWTRGVLRGDGPGRRLGARLLALALRGR